MEQETDALLPKLIGAVQLMMDPSTPHQQRLEAYQACEDFKEKSPLCVQCGAKMATLDHPHIVRHFGLQLMEHCVKYRWYNMSVEDKLFVRNHTIQLISSGTLDLLQEQPHIKDVLSRVLVEMMKREWPQNWPTLMSELDTICKLGPTQTELVLLVFLRLAEDVVAFQSVPTQRRRDMLQALTASIPDLLAFFIATLQKNTDLYLEKKSSTCPADQQQAQVHGKLACAVLSTLTGYLDWVVLPRLTENGAPLLHTLCMLLNENMLQLPAAECLLLITSRKGKLDERKPLLVLFSEEAMSIILQAAVAASEVAASEYHYLFLKRLCQVLTAIGSQLCSLWGTDAGVGCPPHFGTFLDATVAFMQHPGQMLVSLMQCLWASFLRHEKIQSDPILQAHFPRLLEACKCALFKVGYPSQSNHSSCTYSKMEFDTDEDFLHFYSRFRAEVADTVRLVTLQSPLLTFQFAANWLRQTLGKPISQGDPCNLSSPEFVEWDALSVFLESVMTRLNVAEGPKPSVEEGIALLKAVLAFQINDPLILSAVLSCVSALFPYIQDAPDTLPTVLDKIFAAAVFNLEGQTKGTRSRAVKNVRRHACCVLVKACKQYPKLLLPGFEQLYNHIRQLSSDPNQMSQMEKVTLMEAMVLISNEFKDFAKQSNFIGEIMAPIKEIWLSAEIKEALCSTPKFLSYIGVDQAPVEPSDADTCGINRSHITYCVSTILAVMKRSNWPEDSAEAKAGGFVGENATYGEYLRNPCMPHVGALLDNVLALLRTMNGQWLPEMLQKRHAEFMSAYSMMETDRLNVLGIVPPHTDNSSSFVNKSPVERMKNFLCTTYDTCCHILGNVGSCLGYEYYSAPALSLSLLNSVFTHLEPIPDFRLRPVIRSFLKPHITSCPTSLYENAIIPLLAVFGPAMLQRFTEKWQLINQRTDEGTAEDEDAQSQEILEEQMTRLLTRDYLDILNCVFKSRSKGAANQNDEGEEAMNEEVKPSPAGAQEYTISELGQIVLKNQAVYAPMVLCVFTGLTWADTMVCNRCCSLAYPLTKQLVQNSFLSGEDACHLFSTALMGLHRHGQHETMQTSLLLLGVNLYGLLKPVFPEVVSVMLQVPKSSEAKLKALEEKLFPAGNQKPISEKMKREQFRKFVEEIIGKSLSEHFKRETKILNLPPMMKASRLKNRSVVDTEQKDIGLCSLFGTN